MNSLLDKGGNLMLATVCSKCIIVVLQNCVPFNSPLLENRQLLTVDGRWNGNCRWLSVMAAQLPHFLQSASDKPRISDSGH